MPPMSTIVVRSLVLWCSLECTPACQAGGRGFKSRQDRGRVAQLVERAPEKREVRGSTPRPTTSERARPVRAGLACGALAWRRLGRAALVDEGVPKVERRG